MQWKQAYKDYFRRGENNGKVLHMKQPDYPV